MIYRTFFAAILAIGLSAPGPASAYHCDDLFDKFNHRWDAWQEAIRLVRIYKRLNKQGKISDKELEAVEGNAKTQRDRFMKADAEYWPHCFD
ncbi:MAG: hypothetical protein AAF439_14165 [Pseudomonadota bacterium]